MRTAALELCEYGGAVVFEVLRLRARRLGRNGQWLAFIGLEALGYGRFGEVVSERRGAKQA